VQLASFANVRARKGKKRLYQRTQTQTGHRLPKRGAVSSGNKSVEITEKFVASIFRVEEVGHCFMLPPCLCLPASYAILFFGPWEISIPPLTVSYPSSSLTTPPHNSPTIYELRYDREIARMAE